MLDVNFQDYNKIVDIVETCTNDLLELVDTPIENVDYSDLFSYFNQRLSYFALEVLYKFSH